MNDTRAAESAENGTASNVYIKQNNGALQKIGQKSV